MTVNHRRALRVAVLYDHHTTHTSTVKEYLLAIDSPMAGGVTQTQVHAWRFHVDFATPANSTLGLGP